MSALGPDSRWLRSRRSRDIRPTKLSLKLSLERNRKQRPIALVDGPDFGGRKPITNLQGWGSPPLMIDSMFADT